MSSERTTGPADQVAPPTEETEEAAAGAQEAVEEVDGAPGAPMQHGENR